MIPSNAQNKKSGYLVGCFSRIIPGCVNCTSLKNICEKKTFISTLAVTAIVLLGILIARHSTLLSMSSGGMIACSVVLSLDGLAVTALFFTHIFPRKTEKNTCSIFVTQYTPTDVNKVYCDFGENSIIYNQCNQYVTFISTKNGKKILINYSVFEGDPSIDRAMYENGSHMIVKFESELYHVYHLGGKTMYAPLVQSQQLAWLKNKSGTYLTFCPPAASIK